MKLKPLADRVLIRRLPAEEMTQGGLIIPDTAKEKPVKGVVVAAGPGKTGKKGTRPMAVTPGQTVLFGKFGGTELKIDGADHVMLRDDEILAIVEA